MDKRQWPELVGADINQAKEEILKTHPDFKVFFVPEGSMTTKDLRQDRVRIFHNAENKVISIPKVG